MCNTESTFCRGLVMTAVQSPLDNRSSILSMQVEPYFWEEGGNPNVDWWAKVRHSLHFGGVKAVAGAEAIGEVVANTLGLSDSKYQYVIDALEADEIREKREQRDEEDRRQMALEEEAAKARERREQQDGEVKQDSGAIELGDTRLSLPDSGGETALPEGSTA
ncbi:unnamed protein product [Ectocarpus sp. 12 AP-2014]